MRIFQQFRAPAYGVVSLALALSHPGIGSASADGHGIRVKLLADVAEDRPAQAILIDDALAVLSHRAASDGNARAALDRLRDDKVADALTRIEAAARSDEPSDPMTASQMWRVAGFVAGPSDPARSAVAFEAALRLRPDDEAARFGLGVAQASLGKRADARATFAIVLAATKDEPDFFYQYWAGLRAIDLALLAHDGATAAGTLAALRGRLAAEIARDPAKTSWTRDLASSLHVLGARYTARHDTAAALATQKDALVLIEALAAAEPDEPHLQRDLAVSREILADATEATGDTVGALADDEAALAGLAKLVVADPRNTILRRDVARVDEAAARLMIERSRFADAKRLLLESIGTATWFGRVFKEGGTDWADDLARREEMLGDMLQDRTEDHAGAVFWFDALRSIDAWLVRNDPASRPWRLRLASAYRKLAIARDLDGDHEKASEDYRHMLGIGLKLVEDDPADMTAQADLAVSYDRLGMRGRAGDSKEAALGGYAAALAIRALVVTRASGNAGAKHALALAYERLADVKAEYGDEVAALRAYRSAAAIYDLLLDAAPDDPVRLRDAGVAYNEVGCAELKLGDTTGAIADFRRRHALFDRAAALRPDVVETQGEFVISYDQLLDMLRSAGRSAEAADLVRSSRTRMADIAKRDATLGKAIRSIADAEASKNSTSPQTR